MPESTRNMFLDHLGHIRNDVCDTIKKIQPGTNVTSKCFTFGGNIRQLEKDMKLKKAQLIQFSMPESIRNKFLSPLGHIRNDVCDTIKKICVRKKGMNFKVTFQSKFLDRKIKMDLVQSVFNVRKY